MRKISIITAVYNGENFLPKLIESISKQTYDDFQFIIIDGGSKDKTVKIINENESIIDYWISEPDKGIYDAWNKGLEKASGDWIMFLGCDDILMPNALNLYSNFINNLDDKEEVELISSKVQMIDKNERTIRVKGWPFQWPLFLREMTIAHTGALHSKKLFWKYGIFNTDYRIVGDFELLLRAGPNLKSAFMNEITVTMREGGASDSVASIKEHFKAAITTGKYSVNKAFRNASIVYIKFQSKKLFRTVGLNLYIRNSNKVIS